MYNPQNDFRRSLGGARRTVNASAIAMVLLALTAVSSTAGPPQDDLKVRRSHAMERLGPDTIAIFWSAPTRVYSNDVNYEYGQDSNLLYLTGIDQEETILVLMPGNDTRKEMLFVREADARREHWNGHPVELGDAWILRKGNKVARCILVTHPLGWVVSLAA